MKATEELKKGRDLTPYEQNFRMVIYQRYKDMWIHWTPHIWSIPMIAATINFFAFSSLFDTSKKLGSGIQLSGTGIIVLLNLALTLGVWRTRYMQQVFGKRLQELEREAGTPPVQLYKFSSSLFYALVMTIIFLISLSFLIVSILTRWY